MGIPGQIGFSLSYVVDLINPERRSMTWNFYNASARYVTLLILNIIRPLPQRIMVAVSWTNVLPARPVSLIHAAANFASFLRLRGLSINESTFCRMVWK